MSDVLTNKAARAAAIQTLQEDAAIFNEELLAEAMTIARHVYIAELSKAQRDVADLRLDIGDRWPTPGVMDSWAFLVTEVGEVGDALLRTGYGQQVVYSRNNAKSPVLTDELGDVYLMLCTLATALGINLDEALQGCIDKLRSKHDTT